jgi:hypothetical protein
MTADAPIFCFRDDRTGSLRRDLINTQVSVEQSITYPLFISCICVLARINIRRVAEV